MTIETTIRRVRELVEGAGYKFTTSELDPRLFYIARRGGGKVVAVTGWRDRGLFAWSDGGKVTAVTPEDKEAAKAERRRIRELTAQWVEASVGRVEFLQTLVAGKSLPKGWEPIVADRMLTAAGSFSTSQLRMMLTILKLKEAGDSWSIRGNLDKYLAKNPSKAVQVMIAVELGCVEGGFEFDRKGWAQKDTVAYLKRLKSWGYTLSEVESLVVAGKVS